MVTLDANINGENSEDLKLNLLNTFFVYCRQFKGCNQFKGSNQKIKGVNFPYLFFAFIMDENQVDEIGIVDHGNVNEKK